MREINPPCRLHMTARYANAEPLEALRAAVESVKLPSAGQNFGAMAQAAEKRSRVEMQLR
jgi:hypothetical protein